MMQQEQLLEAAINRGNSRDGAAVVACDAAAFVGSVDAVLGV